MAKKIEELDRVFSLWVRQSHARHDGYVTCYTCDIQLPWQEAQNGHWQPRGFHATRFDENNCRPQCRDCNEHRNGMVESFEEHLRDDLGDEAVDALVVRAKAGGSHSDEELSDLIRHYRGEIKRIGGII